MREPSIVLDTLRKIAVSNQSYVFDKLYRNLYNPEFYLMAYGRIYPKQGNMTKGSDGQTIDGFGLEKIEKVIELIKTERYQPAPARRVYIPKKQGGKRPLGIPSTYDKIVQEIVRLILEHIYEASFSIHSHGFRPNRSCHTAIEEVYQRARGTKWWIEGDIKGFFDNINHHVLMSILRKRIKDEKFLRLIWKFLRAGYLEDWKHNLTYSGTPQGGIISPLLANIYLNELDKYMENYIQKFNRGKRRRDNKEYKAISYQISRRKEKLLNGNLTGEEMVKLQSEIKSLEDHRRTLDASDPMDGNFRRMSYTRYADDFLIGIIGSKAEAEKVKSDIKTFLAENLKLELSDEKTLITHWKKPVRFLGFDITIQGGKEHDTKRTIRIGGSHVRSGAGMVKVSLPHDAIRNFMLKNGYIVIDKEGNWVARERGKLKNNDDLEIVSIYNSEIRGFYNYYSIAYNVFKFNHAYALIEQSFLRTLAMKYKTKTSKIIKKFSYNGELGVYFKNALGLTKFRKLYNEGFPRKKSFSHEPSVDIHVNTLLYSSRTSLEERIKANKCEWCGTTDGKFEVHHVRKLKDLKGKARWEQFMLARNRKTIVLCVDCHVSLHQGKLD
ncbi:reverse transcriptase/maturase family protein [Aneurinibacillus thermoaerophilus]|uniref:reverse transcriptase/maturase family protein n=1 Tax=Aneurinibacillus thermoaerophilus TaxID=143495 RepID=UPI002E1CF2CB|nr:reverse transcriptase domain-containing protein [Aneurinibacillus thermoaerophilus]